VLSLAQALAARREARTQADAAAALDAIRMVRPSRATALIIGRLAWLTPGRAHVALARLEREGRVVSRWADGPYPRRRLYAIPREATDV
jgi:hypothetical protein